jgi:hypothetical protein
MKRKLEPFFEYNQTCPAFDARLPAGKDDNLMTINDYYFSLPAQDFMFCQFY